MSWRHLPLFTSHNLAMVSDWLDKKGEVSVYVTTLSDQGVDLLYLIRSLHDLKALLWDYSRWEHIIFTVTRTPQFSLYGMADTALLERALALFPDGHHFYVAEYTYYPDECADIDSGRTHSVLLRILADSWSHPLALAEYGPTSASQKAHGIPHILEVMRRRDLVVSRSQDTYAPYDANPARYQWIVDLWHE